jgi:hypothetical protein
MNKPQAPQVGVWRAFRALGQYRLVDAMWPGVFFALAIGAGGAALAIQSTDTATRVEFASEALTLAGVLLAVTFAALAFVVAIPPGSYLRLLGETSDGGMQKFLDPFLMAVGAQIGLILLAIGYRLFATHVPNSVDHIAFGGLGFLVVFAILDIAALARQLVFHGVLRARDAVIEAEETEASGGSVKRLPERRG